MARALIVGCGCHGRELGGELVELGWRVRGTSRDQAGVTAIERAGLEGALADPERPGSILDLVGDVTVVVWLLGCARGVREATEALHGARLEGLLARLVDTPVRGFAYEAAGSVQSAQLAGGRAIAERAAATWWIPLTVLRRERDEDGWAESTAASIAALPAGG